MVYITMISPKFFFVVSLLLMVAHLINGQALTAVISSMTPHYVGTNGGQYLTLLGVNFMMAEGTTASVQGSVVVYVGNSICTPVEYYLTENMYVCIIPRSPLAATFQGTVLVEMYLIGTGYGTIATCQDPGQCQLQFSEGNTPTMSPSLGGMFSSILSMPGYWPGGSEITQYDARIGGSTQCVVNYMTNTSTGQYWYEEPLSEPDFTMQCQVQEQVAGRYNFTVLLNSEIENPPADTSYGLATPDRSVYRVDDGDDALPYTFVQYPSITQVVPNNGGVMGGGLVTITGSSFGTDCNNIQVKLSGKLATLVSCSMDQLVVSPAAQSDASDRNVTGIAYAQSGVVFEKTSYTAGQPESNFLQIGGFTRTDSAGDGYYNMYGVFVAPYTALYTFLVSGGDGGWLWISNTSTKVDTNTQPNAYCNGGDIYYPVNWFIYEYEATQPFSLTAGDSLYLFMQGKAFGGGINVGVRIHNSSLTGIQARTQPFLPTDTFYQKQLLSVPTIQEIQMITPAIREIQAFYIQGASSGSFGFVAGTVVSSAVLVNDTVYDFLTAINQVQACYDGYTSATVTYIVPGEPYLGMWINLTYPCPNPFGRVLLQIQNIGLDTTKPSSVLTPLSLNFYSVQVQLPSAPLGGTYALNYGGNLYTYDKLYNDNDNWTPQFNPSNTNAQSLHDALVSLTGIDDVEVSILGNGLDSLFIDVAFYNPNANVSCLNIDTTYLIGDVTNVACSIVQPGSYDRQYTIIPGDWMFQVGDQNQVQITVSGIPAVCAVQENAIFQAPVLSSCSYTYLNSLTPTITGVNPTSGELPAGSLGTSGLQAGMTITVLGSGFTANSLEDNVIQFLPNFESATATFPNCVTTVATLTSITCLVPDLSAGEYNIQVQVLSKGVNALPTRNFTVTYALRIDSVYPLSGSVSGGQLLFVSGTGFHPAQNLDWVTNDSFVEAANYSATYGSSVAIGGSSCVLELVSFTSIICRVPPLTSVSQVAQTILIAGSNPWSSAFYYNATLTPQIVSVSPVQVSSGVSTYITIVGSGFTVVNSTAIQQDALEWLNPNNFTFQNHFSVYDNSLFTTFAVHFGQRACSIQSVTDSQLICLLVRSEPENLYTLDNAQLPQLYVQGKGFASVPNDEAVEITLQINSITPTFGSFSGGQYLTITGSGFANISTAHVEISVLPNVTLESFPALNYSSGQAPGYGSSSWNFLPLTVQCDIVSITFTQIVCFTESTGLNGSELSLSDSMVGKAQVIINDISSVCGTEDESISCYYGWSLSSTPVISSSSPSSGGYGTVLTLNGTNFNHQISFVLLGLTPCPVLSHTSTSITCSVAAHTASTVPIQILFADIGFASSINPFTFQHILFIDSFDVQQGSYAGGTKINVYGNGFSTVLADNVLAFTSLTGTSSAMVLAANASQLTILTPSALESVQANLNITTNMNLTVTGYYYDTYVYGPNGMETFTLYPVLGNANPPIQSTAFTTLTGNTQGQDPTSAYPAVFQYLWKSTPTLTNVVPNSGTLNTAITIQGALFGASQGSSNVSIGNVPCSVSFWNASAIICSIGATPGGYYTVDVYISNLGLAYISSSDIMQTSFNASVSVTSFSPLGGGYGGGTLITLTGSGFSQNLSANNLQICNTFCSIQSASFTEITCLTDTLATLDRIRAVGPISQDQIMGTIISNMGVPMSEIMNAFDMNPATIVVSSSSLIGECWLGMDMGPASALVPTVLQWFAPYTQASSANGGTFQVSNDLNTWVTLATISNANEAWNYITLIDVTTAAVNVTEAWRYIRYFAPPNGLCEMAELEFIGFNVSSINMQLPSTGFAAHSACPVSFTVNAPDTLFLPQLYHVTNQNSVTINLPQPFSYDLLTTPLVTDITPNMGSSLGGTLVTISGSGFVSNANTSVFFSSYPCLVQTVNSTTITCVTTQRSFIGPSPSGRAILVVVDPTGVGNALLAADTSLNTSPLVPVPILPYYMYADRWSSINTWLNNEPPLYNDTVIIPQGQVILMDISPPLAFVLLIQGVLIWDRQENLSLDAYYIWINGGTFELGTEDQPFMQDATITLHGNRIYTLELPYIGSKVLNVGGIGDMTMATGYLPYARYLGDGNPAVSDNYFNMDGRGVLDIHGQPRIRSWTKVASNSLAGTNIIIAAENVDFRPGETIMITASSGDMYETEVLTVSNLASDSRTITTVESLQFDHISQIVSVGGEEIDMRVEVGLLSRNIVVQGDSISDSQQYGAHTMMTAGAIMRIENTEFTHCGQGFNLGRYCIHWHMAGDAHESYAKSNSIHRSYQRATTVHGTEYVTVFDEVAYDVKGHTFFIEDGGERDNTFDNNLGAFTQPLYTLLASDGSPATFWTTTPLNAWTNNVAAGSAADGFWFDLPNHPGGPSYTTTICPISQPLGQFLNNTAKNNGQHGLEIYNAYVPLTDPCDPNSAPLNVYFYNLTAYNNRINGIFTKTGGQINHRNHKLVNNNGGAISWVIYEDVQYSWIPALMDLLLVGSLDQTSPGYLAINLPQSEFFYVANINFVNWNAALTGCNSCDAIDTYAQGGQTTRMQGLNFTNVVQRTVWSSPFKEIFFDLDGSLTGLINGTATPYYSFNEWPECTKQGIDYDYGIICNASVRVRRMQIDYVEPDQLYYYPLDILGVGSTTNQSGVVNFRTKEIYGWVYPMVTSKTMINSFASEIDWTNMLVRYSEPEYVDDLTAPNGNEFVLMQWGFIDYRYSYQVLYPANSTSPYSPLLNQYSVPYINTSAVMNNVLSSTVSSIGSGQLVYDNPSLPQSGLWSLLLNTVNTTELNAEYYDKYTVFISAEQCPPQGCPQPQQPGTFTSYLLWSAASTWSSIIASINATMTKDGLPPQDGADFTVPSDVYLMVDIPYLEFSVLQVQGKLEFQDGTDHEMIALNIAVTGFLVAGSPSSPFMSRLNISLTGDRTSQTLVVTNNVFLGNKVIAVYGTMSLHGSPRQFVQTRLTSTANVGDTFIIVSDPVSSDWFVGDSITISSTEYNYNQSETLVITGIQSSNGETAIINIDRPLLYRHFSGSIHHGSPYVGGGYTTLAAVVILTTRNIIVSGNMSDCQTGYGGSIVVTEAPMWSPPSAGNFSVSFVQFQNMGKLGMTNSALTFQYFNAGSEGVQGPFYYQTHPVPTSPALVLSASLNIVQGCSFVDAWHFAISGLGAQGVVLDSNVMVHVLESGINFDNYSFSAVITNNVIIGMYRSSADMEGIPTAVHPTASYYIDVVPMLFSNNLAAGSNDAGFTLRMTPCGTGATLMFGNEAIGNEIGLYALPDWTSPHQCVDVDSWIAWKNTHIGILTVDQLSNVQMSNIVVSDNHIGISLNFYRSASNSHATLSTSVILGSTSASTCSESLLCRAVGDNDMLGTSTTNCASAYGNSYRRLGIITSSFLDWARTCEMGLDGYLVCDPPNTPTRPQCAMPWERRYGLPASSWGVFNVSQTTFAFWNSSDCGLISRAIAWNPTQVDNTPIMNFQQITWNDTDAASKFSIEGTPNDGGMCGAFCDGRDQLAIRDNDGTLLDIPMDGPYGHTLTSNNAAEVAEMNSCQFVSSWNAYACANTVYRRMIYESESGTRQTREIGPIIIHRNTPTINMSYFSVGPITDPCPQVFPFDWFPFLVQPGYYHDIMPTGSTPSYSRITYQSADPSEKLLVSLFYEQPLQLSLFVGNEQVNALTRLPILSDPIGSWVFDPQARRAYIVIGGVPIGTSFNLIVATMIQVTMQLAVDFSTFDGANVVEYLALLLSINPNNIKVASVHSGSTIAQYNIEDVNSTSTDPQAYQQAQYRLANLSRTLISDIQNATQSDGTTYIGGYQVIALSVQGPSMNGSNAQTVVVISAPSLTTGLVAGVVAGIAVAVIIAVCITLAFCFYYYRKNSRAARFDAQAWHKQQSVAGFMPVKVVNDFIPSASKVEMQKLHESPCLSPSVPPPQRPLFVPSPPLPPLAPNELSSIIPGTPAVKSEPNPFRSSTGIAAYLKAHSSLSANDEVYEGETDAMEQHEGVAAP